MPRYRVTAEGVSTYVARLCYAEDRRKRAGARRESHDPIAWPDALEMMERVRRAVGAMRIVESPPSEWMADRIEAVLDALLDPLVTYGFIDPKGPGTPMLTERDFIVQALYTGKHERAQKAPQGEPEAERHECQRCGSDEWTWCDYRGCSDCFEADRVEA